MVVQLDTLQVVEHVPFESRGSSDSVDDDVLGVSYQVKKADKPAETKEAQSNGPAFESQDDLDESLPF